MNFFEKFFQEYNQSVQQFGTKSGLTFRRADLGPNCLQRLSADDTRRQRVKKSILFSKGSSTECHMGLSARKPVFGVSDKVRLNPVYSATETSQKVEISLEASLGMILSNK